MARANRHMLPGHVWHITHRCHKREFLLKFARDRKHWLHWLYEAKRRHGLSILNYAVTSNHVHLLVKDCGKQEIPASMQLLSGCIAQEYNRRKGRKGAFWEDRYHATAVATDDHLRECLLYIDLNMVRAGVVNHPGDWHESGFSELLAKRQRYKTLDTNALMELLGIERNQRYDEAIAVMLQAIELFPDNANLHGAAGVLYERQQIPYRAKEEYRQALLLNPKLGWVRKRLERLLL